MCNTPHTCVADLLRDTRSVIACHDLAKHGQHNCTLLSQQQQPSLHDPTPAVNSPHTCSCYLCLGFSSQGILACC